MKTNLKRISRRTLSIVLCILMLFSTLMVGTITASAYDISSSVTIYYADTNTSSWGSCNMYIWKSDYNTNYTFSKISNTNIYYRSFSGGWSGYTGFLFNKAANDWTNKTSDIKEDVTANRWYSGTSSTGHSTISYLNGSAKVVCMLSNDGSTYAETADSNCIATVSGYKLASGATSATSVSASTGSASNVSISAAYGSTISYSATAGSGYTFKGFSSTNSSSLPSSLSSTKTNTASGINGSSNTTYYAYFEKEQSPTTYTGLSVDKTGSGTVTISADSCAIGDSVNITASPATGYSFTKWTATDGTVGSATTANTTFTPSANNAKATATFTETLYDVTVKADGSTATTVQAGVDTKPSITAEDKTGYKFSGWTVTGDVTVADSTAKTTTVSATGTGTVTANYEEVSYVRLYYSNPNNWSPVYAYLWIDGGNTKNKDWPGEKITSNTEVINDVTYYYVEFDSSIGYDYVIFNNGNTGSGNQTGDLDFTSSNYGQYYNGSSWQDLPTVKVPHAINGTTDSNGAIAFYSDSSYNTQITEAEEGDAVYVKVTPNSGCALDTLTAGTTDITTAKSFTMPDSEITVSATFVKAYSVTVKGASYSSTPADLTAVKAGTNVTITLPATTGVTYEVTLPAGVTDTNDDNGVIEFVMPAEDVSITVESLYAVNVATPANGTASVDKTSAKAGETITVTATPNDGYELDTIKYGSTTITGNTFTMPAAPTTVTVTFKETLHTVTITNSVNSTTSTKDVGKITAVSISAATISGYTFSKWEVVSGTATITDPTSADTSVKATTDATINAVYTEDLSTDWELGGNFENSSDENDWVFKDCLKKSGESSSNISYVSVDLLADTTYYFKYVTKRGATGATWYGRNDYTITDNTECTLNSSGGNCKITTVAAGTYIFKFDSSTKKVSVTYPALGPTTKYDLTIDAPTPISDYVTDYSVTYTVDRAETTATVAKGDTISVDEGSTVTITANEITGADGSDIVSVESWFVNGSEDKTQNTKTLTLSNIAKDTTVYPKVYGKIKVASVTPDTTGDNPVVTVVMGDSADQAGKSTKYKLVLKVKDSSNNVTTYEGTEVASSSITEGQQYTFDPITITDLSKGEYTVTAEIIGYNENSIQVAYGKSTDTTFTYGYSYKDTAYTGDVAWVDAVPSYNKGDKATLIKWDNYKGNNKGTRSTYTFYLPSSVDMNSVTIYHNFTSLKIGDQTITSGSAYSFTVNTEYNLTKNGTTSGTVKFMQGSSGSTQLYLNTTNSDGTAYDLPMELHTQGSDEAAQNYKESVTCIGTEVAVDQKGTVTTNKLKKFKGRGNSSWKASCDLYGKYAFNMTLKDSESLFGLAGDNTKGNTKYSLLANNMDEAQIRNSYVYKLAKELGYEYFPNFQMADVYDNGLYMGSYLVCQKVELGSKGMITEPEIKYDDPVDESGQTVDFTIATGKYDGCSYQYSTNRTDSTNYNSGGTYLMEFELNERYTAELSWFISKKGQAIVVASPENASKNEMEFIIGKWNTVETAVYNGNLDSVRDKIDVESFAKMYLIQELTKNLDACSTSYNILYKSAEDKFYAEPVWDFDWTIGQYASDPKKIVGSHDDASTDLDATSGFFARYKGQGGDSTSTYDFEAQLCQNSSFWSDVQTIWTNEFYDVAVSGNTYLKETYISAVEDTIAMNEYRWGFIASDLSTGWGSKDTGDTFEAVTSYTTDWITNRLTWLNGKIPPTMYTVKAGEGATMTYMDNMGNGKLNAYTQFAAGTRLTFTAANQQGMEFQGWSTDGTNVDSTLGTELTMVVSVSESATYTPIFKVSYQVETTPVTYYVDMHGDSDRIPTIIFADGDTLALTKVGSSTVYSGTYDTKYYVDENGSTVDIVTKLASITAGDKTLPVNTKNTLNKKCLETGEVWIEATQSIADAETTDTTTQAKGATITNGTTKRVYWSNKGAYASSVLFSPPKIYYWTKNDGSEKTYVEWNSAPAMINISGNNYYYDVPVAVNRMIVKDSYGQTVDITITDTAYAFAPGNSHETTDGKYNAYAWDTQPADPNPISYASSYELYDDDTTGTHSIAPTLNPNATATYSVADSSIATVGTDGTITPKAIGSTKVTITITGSSNDTATVETTIKVIDRPTAAIAAYAIMSYQSNTSSFQAVGGTLGTLTTTLAGSAYSGVTTGGIIDGNTVKYAVVDPTVTGYADIAVTVTAPSTGNENYVFVNWTKNNNAISDATNDLTVTLNTVSTDKYIVTYQLDSVQVVFTYNFVDYDTSSGYEYVVDGPTKAASYKTAPKYVHASAIEKAEDGIEYVVTDTLKTAAETNMPNIISNYFSYSLDKSSVSAPTMINGIYYVTATMTNTARTYTVSVGGTKVGDYYFQNEVSLDANKYGVTSDTGYVWKIVGQDTPISDKQVYTLKVGGDINLTVAASEGTDTIKNLSVINATFHEIKTNNNTNYVGQNFYIQNFYRQDDPVYDESGNEVEGATNKTFEGAGVLSYKATYDSSTGTYKPVSATVRNFDYTTKTALLDVAKDIGVNGTGNSDSNSIHEASGLNYSFVKGSDTVDDITGQEFMKYSQTQGCYSYFYQAVTEQSKLYRSQYYVVYSYYVYSYTDTNGVKQYVYVMSDQYATAKVYAS